MVSTALHPDSTSSLYGALLEEWADREDVLADSLTFPAGLWHKCLKRGALRVQQYMCYLPGRLYGSNHAEVSSE